MTSPTTSKTPRNSLAERLQRSRRHRNWIHNQLDSASVGGGSIASTGNISTASEPPQSQTSARQRIKVKATNALQSAPSPENMSINSTSSTPSPEKQSLADRRQKALQLGRRRGESSNTWQSPPAPASKPPAAASPVIPKPPAAKPQEAKPRVENQSRLPAKQPNSPCESMLYQASTMEDPPEGRESSKQGKKIELSQPPFGRKKIGNNASPVVYSNHQQQHHLQKSTERAMKTPVKMQRSFPVSKTVAAVPTQDTASLHSEDQSTTPARFERGSVGQSSQYSQPSQTSQKEIKPPPPHAEDEQPAQSNVKSSYGAFIETPNAVSVASLRASFNNRGSNKPIMPMNSSDPRIRQSLPASKSSVKHESNNDSSSSSRWGRPAQPARDPEGHFTASSKPINQSSPAQNENSSRDQKASWHRRQSAEEPSQSAPKPSTFPQRRNQTSTPQDGQPGWKKQEPEAGQEDRVQQRSESPHNVSKINRKVSWQGATSPTQDQSSLQSVSHSERDAPPSALRPSWNNRQQQQMKDSSASQKPWQKDAFHSKSPSWRNQKYPNESHYEGPVSQQLHGPPRADKSEFKNESPVILPQKPLTPVILPQKEQPSKIFPPAILPVTAPQGQVMHEDDQDKVVRPSKVPGESQDDEIAEMMNHGREADSQTYEATSPSLGLQTTQKQIHKPPTYRPPAQSVQSQKSPWQKWSHQHSNQSKHDLSQTESTDDDFLSREGDLIEEKKSGDLSFDEDAILDAAADEALGSENTYLARMAADSTLIADYEEAIKHASRQMSYDEEDSYISGGFTNGSSAIPQELPIEFQQALSRSPVRTNENESLARSEGNNALRHLVIQESEDESLYIEDSEEKEIQNRVEADYHKEHEPDDQGDEQHIQNKLSDLRIDLDEHPNGSIGVTPTTPEEVNNYPRVFPSQRDSDAYRMGYFGDESPASIRGKERRQLSPKKGIKGGHNSSPNKQLSPMREDWNENKSRFFGNSEEFDPDVNEDVLVSQILRKKEAMDKQSYDGHELHQPQHPSLGPSPEKNKAGSSQILNFWSSGAASEEEQNEAISFNETHQWLDRDPDLDGFRDDISVSSDHDVDGLRGLDQFSPQIGNGEVAPVTPSSRAWSSQNKFNTPRSSRENERKKSRGSCVKAKEDVFDPFGDNDELKIENCDDLFSPLPDPFMTEESFSPPDWNTPRGQINYYDSQSPDFHGVEI